MTTKFTDGLMEHLVKKGYEDVQFNEQLNLLVCKKDGYTIYLSNLPFTDDEDLIKQQEKRWSEGKDIYITKPEEKKVEEPKKEEKTKVVDEYEEFKKTADEVSKELGFKGYASGKFIHRMETFGDAEKLDEVVERNITRYTFVMVDDYGNSYLVEKTTEHPLLTLYYNMGEYDEESVECQNIDQVKEEIKKFKKKSEEEKWGWNFNLEELVDWLDKFTDFNE